MTKCRDTYQRRAKSRLPVRSLALLRDFGSRLPLLHPIARKPRAPGTPASLTPAKRLNLPLPRPAFIVASATMPDKKHRHTHGTSKKSSQVPLAPAKPAKTPAPAEQADGSPKPTDTNADEPTKQSRNGDQGKPAGAKQGATKSAQPGGGSASRKAPSQDDSASSTLRCYNIPDYRLEQPEFRIFMSGEGSNVEYRIEGDLSRRGAAHPRVEISFARAVDRHLPLDAAEPPHGSGAGKSLQAGQGGRRRLLRPRAGRLLVRFGLRAGRRRLARPDDPQPGRDAGARLHRRATSCGSTWPRATRRPGAAMRRRTSATSRSAMCARPSRCWAN